MADKNVTVRLNFVVDSSGVAKAGKHLNDAGDAAEKAAKSTAKATNALRGFVTAGMAIMIAKKSMDMFVKSIAATEEGSKTLKEISKAGNEIQIAFAEGAMPAVETFLQFLTENKAFLEDFARGTGKAFTFIGDTIALVMSAVVAAAGTVFLKVGVLIQGLGFAMEKLRIKGGESMSKMGDDMVKGASMSFTMLRSSWGILVDDLTKDAYTLTRKLSDEEKKKLEDEKKNLEKSKKLREQHKDIIIQLTRNVEDARLALLEEGYEKELALEETVFQRMKEDTIAKYKDDQNGKERSKKALLLIEEEYLLKLEKMSIEHLKEISEKKKTSEEKDQQQYKELLEKQASIIEQVNRTVIDGRISRMKEGIDKERVIEKDRYDMQVAYIKETGLLTLMQDSEKNNIQEKLYTEHLARMKEIDKEYLGETQNDWSMAQEQVLNDTTTILNSVQAMAQSIQSIIANITAIQVADINETAEAQKAQAKATIKNKKALDKEIAKIDAEAAKQTKEVREKERDAAIIMSIINGAVGIVKGYADYGPIVGSVMAVLTAAVTATQIALIASQSFATGGIVQGESTSGDRTLVRANAGELILNRAQQEALAPQLSASPSIDMSGDIIINGNADTSTVDAIRRTKQEQLSAMREMLLELKYQGQAV